MSKSSTEYMVVMFLRCQYSCPYRLCFEPVDLDVFPVCQKQKYLTKMLNTLESSNDCLLIFISGKNGIQKTKIYGWISIRSSRIRERFVNEIEISVIFFTKMVFGIYSFLHLDSRWNRLFSFRLY